jgi:hypothetical protein
MTIVLLIMSMLVSTGKSDGCYSLAAGGRCWLPPHITSAYLERAGLCSLLSTFTTLPSVMCRLMSEYTCSVMGIQIQRYVRNTSKLPEDKSMNESTSYDSQRYSFFLPYIKSAPLRFS